MWTYNVSPTYLDLVEIKIFVIGGWTMHNITNIFLIFSCSILISVVINAITMVMLRCVTDMKILIRIIYVYGFAVFVAILALYKILQVS